MTGAVAMAVLAAVALAVTVLLAQHALADASEVIVRGEGDVLIGAVATELADRGTPPTPSILEESLAAHAGEGLRYVAVLARDGVVAEAGDAQIGNGDLRPGASVRIGRRVRVAGPLFPRRPPSPGMHRPPGGLLVLELEPPVVETLRRDLTRIGVVGSAAGLVLLAFAVAWSRSAARLAKVEQKAARDERLVALGSMSSVMAHELRNPLASLKGHAQLLVEDLEDEPKKKARAERVVGEAERLEALTTSLLDFVRDGPIERSAVTPAELVARALEGLATSRVTVSLERAPTEVHVDVVRLARALHNLVDNALQASPEGEPVALAITAEGSEVVAEVRDHGAGIPEGDAAQQMFEPFVTTRTKGTGLGLPVARRIAEQHGGTLTAANDPSGGAVFTLRWRDASP